MPNLVSEETNYYMKTGGFTIVEHDDHLQLTHVETSTTVDVYQNDTRNEIVTKLIREAQRVVHQQHLPK